MRVSGLIVAAVCCLFAATPAAAAQQTETGGPPTILDVTVLASHGDSLRDPGHSDIIVGTNRYAEVSVKVTFASYFSPSSVHFKERLESEESDWASGESDGVAYQWSCKAPEDLASYEVQVRGESGGVVETNPALVRTGTFVESVSKKWCLEHSGAHHPPPTRKGTSPGGGHSTPAKGGHPSATLVCGVIHVTGSALGVEVRNGGASCAEARKVLTAFLLGTGTEHGGVWSLPGGWSCRYDAGGGRCARHATVATAELR